MSYSPRIPGDYVVCTLETLTEIMTAFDDGLDSRTAGSACKNGVSVGDDGRQMGGSPGLKKIVPRLFGAVAEYLMTARRAVPAELS